jgi:VCBS repeat-containing protein
LSIDPSFGFSSVLHYPVGAYPASVALGDVNRDGALDIVAADYHENNVSVLLANGVGQFGMQTKFAVGSVPYPVVASDLDADGNLDIITGNSGPTNDVSALLGNGDGTFQTQTPSSVGSGVSSIGTGDFDRDGLLDLVVTLRLENSVAVLSGNGDGTFQTAVKYPVGPQPRSVATLDVNDDDALDLAVASEGSNDVSILLGRADGTFQLGGIVEVGTRPYLLQTGDVNADGILDFVTANFGSDDVSVALGSGDGAFQVQSYPVGSAPASVALGDLDGDGVLDIASANWRSNDLSVLLGNGDGTFRFQGAYAVGSGPHSVALGYLDGDTSLDVVTSNSLSDNVSVLLGLDLNRPPVAEPDAYETAEDAPQIVPAPGVLVNDTDPDGDVLFAVLADGPIHGTLDLHADGSFVYTPDANFYSTDTFTYRAFDGKDYSEPVAVTITVNAVNDPPEITFLSVTSPINEGDTSVLTGEIIDPELDDTHTVTIDWGDGTSDTLNLDPDVLTFDQDHQYVDNLPGNAPYTVAVTVTDEDGDQSDPEQATVTVKNVAPRITSLSVNGVEFVQPWNTTLEFDAPVPGTIADRSGQGTGFTHRMPGTGAAIPMNDSNVDLAASPGRLTITSARSDWFAGSSPYYDPAIVEAPSILLQNVGAKDVEIRGGFRNVQLNDWSDQLGLVAGTSNNQNVKALMHMELLWQYGPPGLRNYLLNSQIGPSSGANNFVYPDYGQTPGVTGLFSNGDDIDLTLSRVAGKWSMSWNNLTSGNTGSSPLFDFPWLDGQDLYVGLSYENPRSTLSKTSEIENFSVTVDGHDVVPPVIDEKGVGDAPRHFERSGHGRHSHRDNRLGRRHSQHAIGLGRRGSGDSRHTASVRG